MTEIYNLFGLGYNRTYAADGSRWPEYFGVELEVENCNLMDEFGAWSTHHDGSLREGIEFVLREPLGGTQLAAAVDGFYERGLVYTSGPRTSTHIHMNMSSNTLDQVRVMILMMYAIEDALFAHVGESRKWAGYAMPLSEMGQERLRVMLSSSDQHLLTQSLSPNRNQERYYGFNVASLRKHGTVEFRYYPGGPSKAELESWLDFAWSMKKLALSLSVEDLLARINSPEDLVHLLSAHLSQEWVQNLLRQVTAQDMFDKFSEAAALCLDGDQLERREKLVFLTQPLLKFVNKTLLEDAGKAELLKVSSVFPVLSMGDFSHYLHVAMDADFRAKMGDKLKPAKPKGVNWADLDLDGNYLELIRAEARRAREPQVERAPDNLWEDDLNPVDAVPPPWEANPFVFQVDAPAPAQQEAPVFPRPRRNPVR